MNVYVVMSNDFPDSVFDTEQAAERYCQEKRKIREHGTPKIHWRVYEFKVRQ